MHTCIHTYIHTSTLTSIHALTRACLSGWCLHMHIHTCMHTPSHILTCLDDARICIIWIRIHTRTHTHIHTHAVSWCCQRSLPAYYTCTHTFTNTPSHSCRLESLNNLPAVKEMKVSDAHTHTHTHTRCQGDEVQWRVHTHIQTHKDVLVRIYIYIYIYTYLHIHVFAVFLFISYNISALLYYKVSRIRSWPASVPYAFLETSVFVCVCSCMCFLCVCFSCLSTHI